jgi:hypothetical protein
VQEVLPATDETRHHQKKVTAYITDCNKLHSYLFLK